MSAVNAASNGDSDTNLLNSKLTASDNHQQDNDLSTDESIQDDYDFENWVRSIPKVELHVHLDGSFDPFLLQQHLQKKENLDMLPEHAILAWNNSKFPVREMILKSLHNPAQFHSLCTCRGHRSLQSMIKCFEIFLPIVRGELSLLHDMAYDFCKRQADQNIIYTEVRYNPHLLAANGSFVRSEKDDSIDPRPVIDAVTAGLRDGEKKFGIQVNQILCCIAWRPDWADEIVNLANERKNSFPCAIVGIDIAAGEEHFDEKAFPDLYISHFEAFQKAKTLDLNVTMHAGEVEDASNISKAVEKYGAKRIGHGYHIANHNELMRTMKCKNIHFEVCPTSSVETGGWVYDEEDSSPSLSSAKKQQKDWKKHPAVTMIENGIHIGFNSDDPAVFNTSLTWQLRIAHFKMGLTRETIWNSILHSVNATFLNQEDKLNLKKSIETMKVKQENKRIEISTNKSLSERVFMK